jgi:hypothetical protein
MTCGITVAPTIETASSAAPPGSFGTSTPPATAPAGGRAMTSSRMNAITTTPTSTVIAASSRRKPPTSIARTANVARAASKAETQIDRPNTRFSPSAAPVNSARSVAMATTSACSHRNMTWLRGSRSRHISGRDMPVAMPSLADIDWMSMAIRFAVSTTQPRA